jgi:hypothetical protein
MLEAVTDSNGQIVTLEPTTVQRLESFEGKGETRCHLVLPLKVSSRHLSRASPKSFFSANGSCSRCG